MDKIYLLLFIIFSFIHPNDAVTSWLDEIFPILDSTTVEISFEYSMTSELNEKKDALKLIMTKGKSFRLESKHKIITAENYIWKIFDRRTNQLFIQDPDENFLKILKYWTDNDRIENMSIVELEKNNYRVNLIDDASSHYLVITFSQTESFPQTIKYYDDNITFRMTKINMRPYGKEINTLFNLDAPGAFILDLRKE